MTPIGELKIAFLVVSTPLVVWCIVFGGLGLITLIFGVYKINQFCRQRFGRLKQLPQCTDALLLPSSSLTRLFNRVARIPWTDVTIVKLRGHRYFCFVFLTPPSKIWYWFWGRCLRGSRLYFVWEVSTESAVVVNGVPQSKVATRASGDDSELELSLPVQLLPRSGIGGCYLAVRRLNLFTATGIKAFISRKCGYSSAPYSVHFEENIGIPRSLLGPEMLFLIRARGDQITLGTAFRQGFWSVTTQTCLYRWGCLRPSLLDLYAQEAVPFYREAAYPLEPSFYDADDRRELTNFAHDYYFHCPDGRIFKLRPYHLICFVDDELFTDKPKSITAVEVYANMDHHLAAKRSMFVPPKSPYAPVSQMETTLLELGSLTKVGVTPKKDSRNYAINIFEEAESSNVRLNFSGSYNNRDAFQQNVFMDYPRGEAQQLADYFDETRHRNLIELKQKGVRRNPLASKKNDLTK